MSDNKRIARNTIFLYIRMVILMCVGLYTSRVVLHALGVDDYGLYNVVGGVVMMFSFLNATLSSSTQRFLNIEIGQGDSGNTSRVFSNAITLHVILAVIIFVLAETVGLWYVNNRLVFDATRITAVLWVYQFSVATIIIQIVQLPFMAVIIAHERMGAYAYLSIYEGVSRLAIALIIAVADTDRMILYGALMLFVQFSVAVFYNAYCQRSFSEARFRFAYDKKLMSQMIGFSSWNAIGNLAVVCNNQGVNILLNFFFGTVINAARGISFQVFNVVYQLINNVQLAVKPQIINLYAAGKKNEMASLTLNAAKISGLLMTIVCAPLIMEIDLILRIWLVEYPAYTPVFITLILVYLTVISMTGCLSIAVHASGYLRNVGICGGGVNLLVLPVSYLLLRMGASPAIPFIVNIVAAFMATAFTLFWLHYYIKFPVLRFFTRVYGTVIPVSIAIYLFTYAIHVLMDNSNEYLRLFTVISSSAVFSLVLCWFFAIDNNTRKKITETINSKVKCYSQS